MRWSTLKVCFVDVWGWPGLTFDAAVHIGMGTDIWFVPFDHVNDVMKDFFINMLLYTATRFLIRMSIILFYLRVFPLRSDNKLGRILVATLVGNTVYNLSFFLAVVFQCQPISHFWTSWEEAHDGHCGNITVLAWVAAITGIIFDAWLLALPFPQLLALNLHWKKKIMGSMMFGVGMAVVVISFIRLKTINKFTRTSNPTSQFFFGFCFLSICLVKTNMEQGTLLI